MSEVKLKVFRYLRDRGVDTLGFLSVLHFFGSREGKNDRLVGERVFTAAIT